MDNTISHTPLMKQYYKEKEKYPDTIMLFRVGDFYETFGDDAIKVSKALNIILTKRSNGAAANVELAGFPHHALDTYVPRLINAGYRVSVCDQLEDPALSKGIVKRGVTEVITPGISCYESTLSPNKNNYLCSVFFDKDAVGLSFLDISTGEFFVGEGDLAYAKKMLKSFEPSEIIYSKKDASKIKNLEYKDVYSYPFDNWVFKLDYASDKIKYYFSTNSLKGFGLELFSSSVIAAGACLRYLETTKNAGLKHLKNISRIENDKYVWMDDFTIKNLELLSSSSGNTLFSILNHTITPMGARLLRKWMVMPLVSKSKIENRLSFVEFLLHNIEIFDQIKICLRGICDLDRACSKISRSRILVKEIFAIQKAIHQINNIKTLLLDKNVSNKNYQYPKFIVEQLIPLDHISDKIQKILNEKYISQESKFIINKGIDTELDEARDMLHHSEQKLEEIRQQEAKKTNISSLKIGFNKVFGYYLEVTNKYKGDVPKGWIRKQTLTNCERYVTSELRKFEADILSSTEIIGNKENQLLFKLIAFLAENITALQSNSIIISIVDVLASFAQVAQKNDYCKPHIKDDKLIKIENGRHPVIEHLTKLDDRYIPNSIILDPNKEQIIVLTGPNMSGKSALLRQVALITLMAQIGCFVPAQAAHIGIVDKIFTRVGGYDNLSEGESTFMVEMNETAAIINNMSERSLIVMDEIGRGTSTYDGISIAKAIIEHVHDIPSKPKMLFATHYHELNSLEKKLKNVFNYNIAVKTHQEKVIFLYKLKKGGVQHSFGINVARLAGIPTAIVDSANSYLKGFNEKNPSSSQPITYSVQETVKVDDFDPIYAQISQIIKSVDVVNTTPLDALFKLKELKELLK